MKDILKTGDNERKSIMDDIKNKREELFNELISEYLEKDPVKEMGKYIQHGNTTTLEHCKNVARASFMLNKKLHLNGDDRLLVQCGILHDMYLYDWHDGKPERRIHGYTHPRVACKNAVEKFGIGKKAQEVILSHMWPLTITKVPKSREGFIVCLADKYCALMETLDRKDSAAKRAEFLRASAENV